MKEPRVTRSNENLQIHFHNSVRTPASSNSMRRYLMRHDLEEAAALFSGAQRWDQLHLRIGESSALGRS